MMPETNDAGPKRSLLWRLATAFLWAFLLSLAVVVILAELELLLTAPMISPWTILFVLMGIVFSVFFALV
jgi:hypothetical protein